MEKKKTLNRYLPVACQGIENAQQGAMRATAVRMVLKYQGSYVGAPDIMLLSLPQLREDQPAHRPFVAAHAKPWLGKIVVYRGAAADGFALLTSFDTRACVGALAAEFYVGPVSRFDLGNALVIVLYSGTLETVADINSNIMQTARFYFCEGAALMALAAVILGETSLFGGRGIIFAGSLLIGTINNGRIIIGLDISEEDGCWRHHYSGLSVWKDAHGLIPQYDWPGQSIATNFRHRNFQLVSAVHGCRAVTVRAGYPAGDCAVLFGFGAARTLGD